MIIHQPPARRRKPPTLANIGGGQSQRAGGAVFWHELKPQAGVVQYSRDQEATRSHLEHGAAERAEGRDRDGHLAPRDGASALWKPTRQDREPEPRPVFLRHRARRNSYALSVH